MKLEFGLNVDKGMVERLICAILPAAVAESPALHRLMAAEVEQVLVKSAYYGHPDPRNGFKRDDIEYRVTLVNGQAVACTCYGFHYHGHCKHMKMGERRAGK